MPARTDDMIDYLKFIFHYDAEMCQDILVPAFNRICLLADEYVPQRKTCKFTALGHDKRSGLNRYVIEIWGTTAYVFFYEMPDNWLHNLRRIDYKSWLGDYSEEDGRAAMSALYFRPAKLNKTTINSKPRHKAGEMRDVGGLGLLYGSRKSDEHGIIMKRGTDDWYSEYRLANKGMARMIETVEQLKKDQPGERITRLLLNQMRQAASFWWGKQLGGSVRTVFEHSIQEGAGIVAAAQQASFFDESEEERRWWNDLTPEQQQAEQAGAFEPTVKGWQDAPANDPDELGFSNHSSDLEDEDDLPF